MHGHAARSYPNIGGAMKTSKTCLAIACIWLAGCATTPDTPTVDNDNIAETVPQFEVRPTSRKSANLLAIEDPITLAVEARVNGEYALAYKHFYAAWLATPESEDVAIGLADMAIRIGKIETAYEVTSQLKLNLETAKPASIASQILAETAVGKSSNPESRLKTALKRAPNDSRLWNALGRHYDASGEPRRAQESFKRALATGGSSASVMNNLGMSLLMQGKKKAALIQLTKAAAADSEVELYDNNRRLTLALMGDYDSATRGLKGHRAADLLNDAGFIAKTRENYTAASTLFKAAIKQSEVYHPRAHANLKAVARLQ